MTQARSDIVIAGAGPAGAFAACLLARRGARVTLLDRARFPREKLCGDTLNPGATALLARHFDLTPLRALGLAIDGMVLTGPGGVRVHGAYGEGVQGLGVTRDVLDAWLRAQAVGAGVRFIEESTVLGPDRAADGPVRLVQPHGASDGAWRQPGALLQSRLLADAHLGPRFKRARMTTTPVVLGPLAMDTAHPGCPGLLLVGDAAGFIDPMTGDGIHFALRGAELAASIAGEVLEGRLDARRAHLPFARQLRQRLGRKRTFDRGLRALVSSARAVRASAYGARVWPSAFQAVIRYAGDVPHMIA